MNDILARIIVRKVEEVAQRRRTVSLDSLQQQAATMPPARGFAAALEAKIAGGKAAVIAEVK
ncbi:MAG: indole-3-glycerol-phosphate synthase TrpC, partial [Lysobacteraceae bacterium]